MLATCFISLAFAAAPVKNTKVVRKYKIHGDLVTVQLDIDFENNGDSRLKEYIVELTPREREHVDLITATANRQKTLSLLNSFKITLTEKGFTVTLPEAMGEGGHLIINYSLHDFNLFLKSTVQLNKKVGLYFNCSLQFPSPYNTVSNEIEISGITSSFIQKMTEIATLRKTGAVLRIRDPVEQGDFEVEYESSRSLPRITEMKQKTVVSHWGNTKQQSFFNIKNAGPKFVGAFSRLDFSPASPCYIENIDIHTPNGYFKPWASDEAGLLTKNVPTNGDKITVPLRGVMLSSWSSTFTAGWIIPTNTVVSEEPDHFLYKAPLVMQAMAATIDEVSSEVVLPEGAEIIKIQIPSLINNSKTNVSSFIRVENLDFNGRTVVRVETKYLNSLYDIPLIIEYKLASAQNWGKIIYLVRLFCVFFLSIIFLRRINCAISIKSPSKQD